MNLGPLETVGAVAVLALCVACLALVIAVVIARQSARTTSELRRHRLAHSNANGTPDPQPVRPARGAHRHTDLIPAQPQPRPTRQERPRP